MTLFEVADLSTVWVEADVYENDIAFLQVGQTVEATVEAFPNSTFSGRLALIYPRLDAATRTKRVRFELENPRHELRPGMFAAVRINTPLESIAPYKNLTAENVPEDTLPTPFGRGAGGEGLRSEDSKALQQGPSGHASRPHPNPSRAPTEGWSGEGIATGHAFLVVPERAVVDSGAKKVVYVEREPGLFEGVEVELGPRNGQYYPVLKGLKAGDKVAAAGGFLIDAETRLNPAAASTYFGASGGPQRSGDTTKPRPLVAPPIATAGRGFTPEDLKNIGQLPEADRQLARVQRLCPITGAALGSMGVPVKITLRGQPVFLCCKGCIAKAKKDPEGTLKKLAQLKDAK
jgi:hypothetical protein